MNAEQLRNIINGAQETPSAHCWNAIQQQLAATAVGASVAVSTSKATAQTVGKTASMAGKGAFSVAKVAVISSVTIAVATVAVITVINLSAPQEPTVPAASAPTLATALPTDTTTSANITDITIPENRTTNHIIPAEIGNPQAVSCVETITNNTTPTVGTTTAPITTAPISSSPTPVSPVVPAPSTPSTPTIKQTVTPPEKDPIANQYHQEDNPDYRPQVRIEIPNTITPNGDGYNDFFIITGLDQCDDYQLIIFNQARKEIFRTKNYLNDWNAANQDGSTFYYTLIYKINNIQEKRTGVIYVLR